ncbi:MAG: hypothetical protein GVY15_09210 [Bacteroidetes bacterium]|jgi:hypothetical protein|nr:hypothetical protein [Bacteroidota bacterium]
MTEKILEIERFTPGIAQPLRTRHVDVVRFVAGGLAMRAGNQGKNPLKNINIEDLIASIRMLAQRSELDIAPFVTQWHKGVEEIDKRDHTHDKERRLEDEFERALEAAARDKPNTSARLPDFRFVARRFVSELKNYFQSHAMPWHRDAYAEAAKQLTVVLKNFVWVDDEGKTAYLDPLVQMGKMNALTIASLNYDNTVEVAGNRLGVGVDLGLERWRQNSLLEPVAYGIELLKLHGSIDWLFSDLNLKSQNDGKIFPQRTIERVDISKVYSGPKSEPALIFGSGNKLTEEGPFLELFRAFERRLEACDELVSIGYSFGDKHINHVIFRWMNRDPSRTMVVVDRPGIEKREHALWADYSVSEDSDRIELMPVGSEQGIEELFS